MDSHDDLIIREWLNKSDKDIIMEFIHCGDSHGNSIKQSIDEISNVSNRFMIITKNDIERKESAFVLLPNILIEAELKSKVIVMVLDILDQINSNESVQLHASQYHIPAPLYLKLFISPFCPNCPYVVKDIAALAIKNPNIYLEIIDGLLYVEKSVEDQVKAVPTLIYNENFRWTGQIRVKDVLDVLTNIKPENLSSRSIQTMIEAGRATAVATLMTNEGKVFKTLYELLLNEKWTVRLGAMVVAEAIGERNEQLANEIIQNLWANFDKVSESVKGDIVYLAGEIGSIEYIHKIESLIHHAPSPDMLDALNDALSSLKLRLFV